MSENNNKSSLPAEHKRRQTLREGFRQLQELVPSLQSKATAQSKSEAVILQQTVEYLNQLIASRVLLRQSIDTLHQEIRTVSGSTGAAGEEEEAWVVDSDSDTEHYYNGSSACS